MEEITSYSNAHALPPQPNLGEFHHGINKMVKSQQAAR